MLRRSICLSTLAVSAMLLAAVVTAHESDASREGPKTDTAKTPQALHARQAEPDARKPTNTVEAPAQIATHEATSSGAAPHNAAPKRWQDKPELLEENSVFEAPAYRNASPANKMTVQLKISRDDFLPLCKALDDWQSQNAGRLATVAFQDADPFEQEDPLPQENPLQQPGDAEVDVDDCGCEPFACDCGCSDCDVCCSCCPPMWTASLAFLALARDLRGAPIVTNGGATVVSAAQFDTGYEPGAVFSLRGPLEQCDLQARYLHSDSFNEAYNRTTVAGDTSAGFILAGGGVPNTWSYQSRLYSLELNAVRPIPESQFEVFAGLAYLRYEEAVNETFSGVLLETENDLFGVQLGGNVLLFSDDQWSVNATGRAGGFYARSKSDYNNRPPGFVSRHRDNADNVAFVGELGVLANYLLSGNTSIEASYHGLWLSGAALAGEQFSTTIAGLFAQTNLNQGEIFFHGFNLGISTRW